MTIVERANEIIGNHVAQRIKEGLRRLDEPETLGLNAVSQIREVNSWIDFASGDNDTLYDNYRLRTFVTKTGKILIIQGTEVDVDPRDERNIG